MESRRTFRLAVTVLVVLVCTGLVTFRYLSEGGSLTSFAVRSILVFAAPPAPQDANGHTNILLLGVGDIGHSAPDLTDSIIVASIDPRTQSVSMLSLPRDLYLADTGDLYPGRINELYFNYKNMARRIPGLSQTGASLLALKSVGANIGKRLNMDIHGVMKLDFTGFERIIDAVGGIDVDVPETIVDYTFPLEEGVVGVLRINKGMQHFTGKQALQYARSRHSTSDFDRSLRQQQILSALKAKVQSQNMFENLGSIQVMRASLTEHFQTTLSESDLFSIAAAAASVSQKNVLRMNLNTGIGTPYSDALPGGFLAPAPVALAGSAAMLVPVSLTRDVKDWGQIRTFAELLTQHRRQYLYETEFTIIPAGAHPREVQKLRNELLRYGFTVTDNAPAQKEQETSRMINSGASSAAAQFFAQLLDLPLNSTGSDTPRILLILGSDFESPFFQTALGVTSSS